MESVDYTRPSLPCSSSLLLFMLSARCWLLYRGSLENGLRLCSCPSSLRLRFALSHKCDFRTGYLTWLRIGQVIAPLLIIQRVANQSALTGSAVVSGNVSSFRARSRRELTTRGVTFPGRDSMSSADENGKNSDEPGVEVETTTEPRIEGIGFKTFRS